MKEASRISLSPAKKHPTNIQLPTAGIKFGQPAETTDLTQLSGQFASLRMTAGMHSSQPRLQQTQPPLSPSFDHHKIHKLHFPISKLLRASQGSCTLQYPLVPFSTLYISHKLFQELSSMLLATLKPEGRPSCTKIVSSFIIENTLSLLQRPNG